MEEKKTTKISLSTFFLILAIIAICVMGYFIYKLNDDKTKATDQVQSLNSQIANLEKSIDNLKVNISESKTEGTSTKSNNSSTINTNFELKGTYQWINPEGPTMTYTFSNGTFTYTETATSKGTYEVSGNKVKIKFDETTDIDGSKYKLPDTEGTINGNTLIIGDITLTKK